MSNAELQIEEREVLLSIYEGDSRFIDVSPTVYQYKYGEENDPKSFLLEVAWTESYPTEKPQVNMDTFYNKHIGTEVKQKIIDSVLSEADQYLGTAMTYSLFEFVKEKENELTEEIPDKIILSEEYSSNKKNIDEPENGDIQKPVQKKQHLTKAQKRRQWDKVNAAGEKPRGWNWVDLVKHLSQTGNKLSSENDLPTN